MIFRHLFDFARYVFHFVQYFFVILYVKAAQMTPPRYFNGFFVKLARAVGPVTPFHKRVADNLDLAFPEKSAEEKQEIGKQAWANLLLISADCSRIPLLSAKDSFYTSEGEEILTAYGLSDKPVLFLSGHIASWEVFRQIAGFHGISVGMTYRGFNNPFFEKLALKLMALAKAPIFSKAKGGKAMISYLLRGGKVMLLADQRFGEGRLIPFFGHPVKTVPFPAEAAIKYNIPLIPVCVQRTGHGKFHIIVKPPLATEALPGESREARTDRILTDMNAALEKFIREKPGEWFWHHLRWRK